MDSQLSDQDQASINAIIQYWYPFADWDRDTSNRDGMMKVWYGGGAEIDADITQKFKADLEAAGNGEREHWLNDHFGVLAYIILTDQFSRNIFRKQGKAFSFDHLALAACKSVCTDETKVNSYKHFEKQFLMMPYMHSEVEADGYACVDFITKHMLETSK